MVTHIGHMGLHVKDIDRSAAFFEQVLGLRVTERAGSRAYLTSGGRHHDLILIQSKHRGYDHVGLEVADGAALEAAEQALRWAGARVVGYEEEPGIDRALRVVISGGHVFKLFCGMEYHDAPPADPDRATHFEHVSLNTPNIAGVEHALSALGFGLSDRVGKILAWWHCNADHHGVALTRYPRNKVHHYAWAFPDVAALTRVADRAAAAGSALLYGLGRHGPGNNHHVYFRDPDGFVIEGCSELAQLGPDSTYELGRKWKLHETNLWGPRAPLPFIRAGVPVASSAQRG